MAARVAFEFLLLHVLARARAYFTALRAWGPSPYGDSLADRAGCDFSVWKRAIGATWCVFLGGHVAELPLHAVTVYTYLSPYKRAVNPSCVKHCP